MDMTDSQRLTPPIRTDAEWLAAHWMPYTGNRQFKADPRLIVGAQGVYFTSHDGRQIFDGLSGLWCSGLGHGRREIAEAIGRAAQQLDYAPAFQFGHPASFALANKLNTEYAGKVRNIVAASADRKALEKRLSEFEGIGPKTVEIFMREAAAVLF